MKTVKSSQTLRGSLSSAALAAMLMAGLLASCAKSEGDDPSTPERTHAILPVATLQVATGTKAAVIGTTFPENTANVFGVTAFAHATTAPSTDWSAAPYINNVAVNSGAASALAFTTAQYYPANGDKVYFYAYAPTVSSLTVGTSSAAPIAAYTITGQEDIMAAQETKGIATAATGIQAQPALAFTHKLMQLRFKVVADASFETGKKVTQVLVKSVKSSAKLDIATGTLTFDGASDKTFALPITTGTKDEITAGGTEMDGCVMLEPVGIGGDVTIEVTAGGVVYDDISVTLAGVNAGTAGTSYLITMTFKRGEIIPTATITDWQSPVDKDTDIDGGELLDVPTVGDFRDGGIIYEVTDLTHYKVFSLGYGEGLWSAKDYELGVGGQSSTDGRANVAAMKAYSAGNTANADVTKRTTGVFAIDFPAAGYCEAMNTGGVTGWYLPGRVEMLELWDIYLANSVVFDAATSANGGSSIPDAGESWSSTEHAVRTNYAWSLFYGDGSWTDNSKRADLSARCVKNTTPPPPAIGYFRDGGVIYWVDPANATKYKVISVTEAPTVLKWAASGAYVIGAGAQSDTDGKGNAAAIKAYYEAQKGGTVTESTFEAAFPAAAYCYNYQGKDGKDAKGSWYLPAKTDLQYLWCAYNGKAPISWQSGESAALEDISAQAVFDMYLTDAGGSTLYEDLWSSTENINSSGNAFYVNFATGGNTDYESKSESSYAVRCVKGN